MTQNQIVERLLAFIAANDSSDDRFNAVALDLFAYQYEHNPPFRRFAQQRTLTPRTVKHWHDIPAIPINAFKNLTLSCCAPEDVERVFMTSGTTQGVRGCSYHADVRVYDASMLANFRTRFMQGSERVRMGILFPTEEAMRNSSLAHYLALALTHFGTPDSHYLIDTDGINVDRLLSELTAAKAAGEPYALLGASYSFVHLMDELTGRGVQAKLPTGSRVLDTGGFKGQSRELEQDEFYEALATTFDVARSDCINMYGMTELSTQFYDSGNVSCPSVKSGPAWIRSRVVNPLTGQSVAKGEVGILSHCDLAHFNICTTILTEDAGVERDAGFVLLGRADGAEAKGCSIAVADFLKAAR